MALGYEWLRQELKLGLPRPTRIAEIAPVTRFEQTDAVLRVPSHAAPGNDSLLQHVLFALRHEGTNLQILSCALPRIDAAALAAEFHRSPHGEFIRKACYLWEGFTGQVIDGIPVVAGPTYQLFDPSRYVTVEGDRRDRKWRVVFNGIGSLQYCPSVELTPEVVRALDSNFVDRVDNFTKGLDTALRDRALAWAYLNETESSFEIERERPSEGKAQAFVELLKQAHQPRALTEDYFVELQNSVITEPLLKEYSFRTKQNWLRGPAPGAAGVTYVPPPPDLARQLMGELLNSLTRCVESKLDPIVTAAIASFGFVFIHPFLDGNGRLSRFLFHQTLARSEALPDGLLLPVSIAMKRNESDYLSTLKQFSAPTRDFWVTNYIDDRDIELRFRGEPAMYRYWDATACVEFSYRMAEQSLERDLRGETEFLMSYDAIVRTVEERYDVRNNDLTTIVLRALKSGGRVSNNSRKQFGDVVSPAVFDLIEETALRVISEAKARDESDLDGVTAHKPDR